MKFTFILIDGKNVFLYNLKDIKRDPYHQSKHLLMEKLIDYTDKPCMWVGRDSIFPNIKILTTDDLYYKEKNECVPSLFKRLALHINEYDDRSYEGKFIIFRKFKFFGKRKIKDKYEKSLTNKDIVKILNVIGKEDIKLRVRNEI